MEGVGEGLLVQGHLPRVQSHGSQAHEPPRRTPDQQGGVGQGGGGGGDGGGDGCLHKEPHGHLWPRRALLPEKKLIFHCTTPDTSLALKNVDHLLRTLDLSLTRAVAVFIGARRLRGLVGRVGDIYYYGPAGHQMIPLPSTSAVTCCFVSEKFVGISLEATMIHKDQN